MNPNDFTIDIIPTYTTIRLNQSFDTEINIEVKKEFFSRIKREKIALILSIGKKEYEIGFTKQKNIRIINHKSKIGFANGLFIREIVLKTTNGQILTKAQQLLNICISSAMKRSMIAGSITIGLVFFVFFLPLFYFWFFVAVALIIAAVIRKSKSPKPDNSQMYLLQDIHNEERLSEENARHILHQTIQIRYEIEEEKKNIENFVEKSQKGLQLQLKTIKDFLSNQEQTIEGLKTNIARFEVNYKRIETNASKLKELEDALENKLDYISNRFNKKLKGLSEFFQKTLQESTANMSEQTKSNQITLDHMRIEVSDHQEIIHSVEEKIESLSNDFASEVTKLVIEFENLKNEILEKTKKKTTDHLSKKDRELLENLDSSGKILKSLEIQQKDTNGRLAKLEASFKEDFKAFEKYRKYKPPAERLFNLEKALETYNASLTGALREINNKVNQFSDITKQKLEGEEKLTDYETSILLIELKSQISGLETRFKELKNEFTEFNSNPPTIAIDRFVTAERFTELKETLQNAIRDLQGAVIKVQQQFVDEINVLTLKIDNLNKTVKIKTLPSDDRGKSNISGDEEIVASFLRSLEEGIE